MIRTLRPLGLFAAAMLFGCGTAEPVKPEPSPSAVRPDPAPTVHVPEKTDHQPVEAVVGPAKTEPVHKSADPVTSHELPPAPEKPPVAAETNPRSGTPAGGPAVVTDPRARVEDRAAMVGGRVITRRDLLERILYSEGPKVLDLMLEVEIARQLAAERGVKTDDADRDRFIAEDVRRQLKEKKGVGAVPDDQFQGILEKIKRQRGQASTDLALERLYYLDRTARQTLKVTEDELKREFERVYGEKTRLRCIMVGNVAEGSQVKDALDKGEDFGRLAEKVSRHPNAAKGGICEPVPTSMLPPHVRSKLAAMKPQDISSPMDITEPDGTTHIYVFQLLGRDPAQNVRFEQVSEDLRRAVEQEKVQTGMKVVLGEIQRRKLSVTYFDDRLRMIDK